MKHLVKHITAISFCIIFFTNVTAQFNPVIAYTPATQVIYIGVDNPIAVTLGEYNLSDVNIKVSEGSIRNADVDGKYLWKICSSKSEFVYLKIFRNKHLLKRIKYPTKELLLPLACLTDSSNRCHYSGGIVSIIQNYDRLQFDYGDALMPTSIKLISYTIIFTSDDDSTKTKWYKCTDLLLSDEIKNQIKIVRSSKKGSILITDIIVRLGCEVKPRELRTLAYNITNYSN